MDVNLWMLSKVSHVCPHRGVFYDGPWPPRNKTYELRLNLGELSQSFVGSRPTTRCWLGIRRADVSGMLRFSRQVPFLFLFGIYLPYVDWAFSVSRMIFLCFVTYTQVTRISQVPFYLCFRDQAFFFLVDSVSLCVWPAQGFDPVFVFSDRCCICYCFVSSRSPIRYHLTFL